MLCRQGSIGSVSINHAVFLISHRLFSFFLTKNLQNCRCGVKLTKLLNTERYYQTKLLTIKGILLCLQNVLQ